MLIKHNIHSSKSLHWYSSNMSLIAVTYVFSSFIKIKMNQSVFPVMLDNCIQNLAPLMNCFDEK